METIFIKRFIKTEADLPKKNGNYWAKTKSYGSVTYEKFDRSQTGILYWESEVDWYLQPTTLAELIKEKLPTKEDIAVEIVATFLHNPHPNQRANYDREKKAFANGAMYVINKLTE